MRKSKQANVGNHGAIAVKRLTIAVALTLAWGTPAWAINKCTNANGKVVFQDAPCAGRGEAVELRPVSGVAPVAVAAKPAASTPTAVPAAPAAQSAPPPPPAPPGKSALEREADACLAWYRPKLRDPAGAYHSKFSKDRRVVTVTMHATNGHGGFVTHEVSCEFVQGKLDEEWTKIHAERGGWQPH